MFYTKKWIALSLLIFSIILSQNSMAFKLKTHVYIGQQVINDLEDNNTLTFEINNNYYNIPVNANVRASILNNRSAYLMGHIGPDAAPDVVVGQTSVHPGALDKDISGTAITQRDPTRYNADDWMKYLLKDGISTGLGAAFVYGYLGHAAADVFAHTYVNQYSGDIFLLSDGETLNEKRHVALESFIDSRVPPLRNFRGNTIGSPSQQIDLTGNGIPIYIRDKLIYASTPTEQYKKSPFSTRLALISKHRDNVKKQANDEYGYWHQLDVWVTQYIASYWTGVQLPDSVASGLVDIGNEIIDKNNITIDQVQRISDKYHSYKTEFERRGFNQVTDAVLNFSKANQSLLEKKQAYEEAALEWDREIQQKGCEFALKTIDPAGIVDDALKYSLGANILDIEDVEDLLDPLGLFGGNSSSSSASSSGTLAAYLIYTFDDWYTPPNYGGIASEDVAIVEQGKKEAMASAKLIIQPPFIPIFTGDYVIPLVNNKEYTYEVAAQDKLLRHYWVKEKQTGKLIIHFQNNMISSEDRDFCVGLSAYVNDTNNLLLSTVHSLEREVSEKLTKTIAEAKNVHEKMLDARNRIYEIQNSVIDLQQSLASHLNPIQSVFQMWLEGIDVSMLEYSRAMSMAMINTMNSESSFAPIQNWLDCYSMSLLGLPAQACQIQSSGKNLIQSLEEISNILKNAPLPSNLVQLQEKLNLKIVELKGGVKKEMIDALSDLLPTAYQDLIKLLKEQMTDSKLNQWFTKKEAGGEHLLKVSNIAERVKAEMYLDGNGHLDPTRYAVVANSIQLAKLALLDRAGLNALANTQGVSPMIFDGMTVPNLVADSFKSLDGNHQWMHYAPPLPRSSNYLNRYRFCDSFSSRNGFSLWNDAQARMYLFNGIFKGPLVPGVTSPAIFNFDWIMDLGYPYKTTTENYPEVFGCPTT